MNTLSSVFGQRQGKLKSMIIILLLAFAIGYVGIYRSIYVHICRTRVYDDMAANIGMIMSANINIKPITVEDNITSYGAGASGVIYAKEKDTYYALTAAHVVSDTCKTYKARTTDIPTYSECLSEQKANGISTFVPFDEYYAIMPDLTVEYICEECDLAVVSFTSDKNLAVANIAGEIASKGERITSIGNPYGEDHFKVTYGKILSDLTTLKVNGRKHAVQKHNAYGASGSSGGAVFDENMELVGINIVGGSDIFGRYMFLGMVTCDQIKECLEDFRPGNRF